MALHSSDTPDSNTTDSTTSAIDLSTVTDPAIRIQIEQLLRLDQPPTQPPTYATITASTSPSIPTTYPSLDDSVTIDIDDTPFTPVIPRNQRSHHPSTPSTQGISGFLAASNDIWNEHEITRILNQDDLANQRRRLSEGRVLQLTAIKRPTTWIKFYFPTVIPSLPVAPNILQQELIIDHIIGLANVDFPVDRLFISTLIQPCTFDGTQCFLGFAALSPSSTLLYGTSPDHSKTALTQLYTLENRLFCLFREPEHYHAPTRPLPTPPPPLIFHTTFKLPHVNHYSENISFIISGLPPQLPHNDVATLRDLATDIFRAIQTAYIAANPGPLLPDVLRRHTSRFHINQILSVRPWSITTATQPSTTPRGRGRGRSTPTNRRNNSNTERLLALVTATDSHPAIDLINIIGDLILKGTNSFTICGGGIDISLIPYHTIPRVNTPHFASLLTQIKEANNTNYAMSQVRIIRDLPVCQRTIANPNHIIHMVQNTPICRAIIPNLQFGRTDPTITCILEHSTDNIINTPDNLLTVLGQTITAFDISPPAAPLPPTQHPHQHPPHQNPPHPPSVPTKASPKPPTTPTHTGTRHIGSSLPTIVSTTAASLRYHALINPAGGIANAGVYKGHFDIHNFRQIAEHVSYPYVKSFATEWEAMRYFTSFYPQCTTRAKILFLNYNAPVESTNMNNPSLRLQQLIGIPTTTPRERDFFDPTTTEPFIILSRQAASQRMRDQGLTPIDSFDFLPADHPREFHSPADLPIDISQLPDAPTFTTNTIPTIANLSSLLPTRPTTTTHDDDDMSQLSYRTQSSLSLHQPPSPTSKRARTTTAASTRSVSTADHHINLNNLPLTTPIAFILPILTSSESITTTIATHDNSIAIHDTIHFAPISITNPTTKLAYITAHQPTQTPALLTLLRTHYPNSHPRTITSLPPSISAPQTLDTTPPIDTILPTNCRVMQCPLYNNGIEEPPPEDPQSLIFNLHQHGNGIHANLYLHTPTNALTSIG